MADNLTLNSGSGGATLATDEDAGSIHYQKIKLADGTANSTTMVYAGGGVEANALRVTIASDSTGVVSVDDNGSTLSIDDGGSSITVDNGGTFAVQAACTNAGTFAVQVDGSALTALQLIDDPVATDGAAAVTKLMQVGGTDGTNAQILSTNVSGHLNIADGGNSITVDNGGTFAVQATCTNAGTFAVQVDGSALTSLQLIDDAVYTDDATFTPATSKLLAIGCQADETATDSVDEGDIGTPRMTLDRQIRTVSGVTTAGGTTLHTNAGTSTLTQIKGSAGQLYWLFVMNLKASVLYLQLFNKASASVSLGTTVADMVFPIPTQATTSGAGFVLSIPQGIAMGTGISYAITTTATGSTTASSGEAYLNAGYA